MIVRKAGLLLLAALCAGCGDDSAPAFEPEYLAVRRPWRAGERDSVIAATLAGRLLNIPGVGDLSDLVGTILDPDSTTSFVPNPRFTARGTAPVAPLFSVTGGRVPGAGFTTYGLDIHLVNTNSGEPDYDWLGVFWYQDSDPGRKGLLLAATANTTYPATAVNTTSFTASGNTAGVGGGEFDQVGATYWEANGGSAPNTFRVLGTFMFGTPQAVTTGPFLGGTSRGGLMNVALSSIRLTRASGAGLPTTLSVNFSGWLTAVELSCTFPSPCTTNALRGGLRQAMAGR